MFGGVLGPRHCFHGRLVLYSIIRIFTVLNANRIMLLSRCEGRTFVSLNKESYLCFRVSKFREEICCRFELQFLANEGQSTNSACFESRTHSGFYGMVLFSSFYIGSGHSLSCFTKSTGS